MSRYWSALVHQLEPYVPGEQPKMANQTKLNTNENPYPPSPLAIAAIRDAANADLRLYPDPNADDLKKAIAEYHLLDTSQVFVGNGSDEVLAHVFHAFFQQEFPILFPDISYSFYPVYCGLYKIHYTQVPLRDDFSIDINQYVRPNGGIIFPNPNAPTGIALGLDEVETLLRLNTQSVVVVDEAYVDFGAQSAISLVNKYPNLLVTQTLSKSRSLAGLRVGFAIGHPDLIAGLERIKNSFNSYPLARTAIAGAVASFLDKDYFEEKRLAVISSREILAQDLRDLGFIVYPSAANFLFVTHSKHDAENLLKQLRSHAIIVRHFKSERIRQCLRITVGTPAQNEALASALTKILSIA